MKRMKRLFALVLAMAMVFAMTCVAAYADDADDGEYCITVSSVDTADHIFEAYQIFSGYTTDGVIANVQWGDGVTATEDDDSTVLTALQALEVDGSYPFENVSSSEAVAAVLTNYKDDSDVALKFADFISGYLSTSATATAGSNNASLSNDATYTYTFSGLEAGYYFIKDASDNTYTQYILVTAGSTTTSYNKVYVKNTYPTVSKSVDDANAAVGDTVTFTITGTVPDMTYYDTYQYVFNDTMSAGLTYVSGSINVYGEDDSGNKTALAAYNSSSNPYGYVLEVTADGTTSIGVSFSDLKSVENISEYAYIVVTYQATVNSSAVLGTNSTGNTNEVTIIYSSDPNWDGTGTEPTDKSTDEIVYVNTYELKVTKYDSDGTTALSGAIFCLYYLDAYDTHYYAEVTSGQITGWTTTEPDLKDADTKITTGDDGVLEIKGLDAGTYYLKEIKAPDGYNLLADPIEITISATTADNGSLKAGGLSAVISSDSSVAKVEGATSDEGIIKLIVYNNANGALPTTGGMGTTLLYVVGLILIAGAVVLLITRRRMRAGV